MEQISLFEEYLVDEKPSYKNWLLIDGNNLLNRTYFATMSGKKLSAPDGRPTTAAVSFLRMMLNYQMQYKANIAVFFDKGKGFRKQLYPAYKEGRNETPELLVQQFPLMREILTAAEIPYFWNDELEADDLIGAACQSLTGHKYILSNDKDLLQLLKDDVSVIARKGSDDVVMTPALFIQDWEGLSAAQIVDIKALAGDSSDNIPGVQGIGDTGAIKIVKHFGTIENITFPFPSDLKRYEKKFEDGGMKNALFFKELTTLKVSAPLQLNIYNVNDKGLKAMCKTLAMKSIVDMLN